MPNWLTSKKARLIRILVEQTAKRVPVIVPITHRSLEVARKEAAEAVGIGAEALMIMPPFFLSPSSEAVQNHIAVIASETVASVIIQYAPIQTGSSLTAENTLCATPEISKPGLCKGGPDSFWTDDQ
jgi:dihydrodipicolinate synthase/N-acetylneuraminate lyase